MVNEEHLKILKQSVEVWNKWREENPDIEPDLHEANLRRANLSGANLSGANFYRTDFRNASISFANISLSNLREVNFGRADLTAANLSGANLREANLKEANLSETDLKGANLTAAVLIKADIRESNLYRSNLSGTNLREANLSKANLSEAKLDSAHLVRTNFTSANLKGTDFDKANLNGVVFGDVDLSTVKGLNTIVHFGPSTIGIDTIYLSKLNIHESFLRGVGVPDVFIKYLPSLTGDAFQYYSCFISYSSKNQDFAEQLYADLQKKGVRCWFAPEDMKIGDKIENTIDRAIRLRDKLLLILSESSVESGWVEREVKKAFDEEEQRNMTVLFPVRIDDAVMDCPYDWAHIIRRKRHIGDFTRWKEHDAYQKVFERLLRDLRRAG